MFKMGDILNRNYCDFDIHRLRYVLKNELDEFNYLPCLSLNTGSIFDIDVSDYNIYTDIFREEYLEFPEKSVF